MALRGTRVLFVCHDYPAADEPAFNEWYNREHLPERANGLPGFNRGRRFEAVGGAPKYAAIYEVDGAAALASPEYLRLVAEPDARSRHFIPRFQGAVRMVFQVRASAGAGEGGMLGVLGFEAAPAAEEALRGDAIRDRMTGLCGEPGIVGAHLLEADLETLERSRRMHLRRNDRFIPWLLLVEGMSEAALERLRSGPLAAHRLPEFHVAAPLMVGAYRLLYSLRAGG